MASKYLIPTPTESISIGGHSGYGKLLFSANSSIYAFKPADSTADWWAIGAVYHYRSTYYIPCIVSDTEEYASSLNDNSWGESQQAVVYPVEYNGKTYYASYAMAGANGFIPANSTIPVENEYTYNSDQITDAAKTLLDLYIADGGSLPGEEQSQEYSKVDYTRINWENKSTSLKTPLNESNLNKMDKAISDLCENLDIAHREIQNALYEVKSKLEQFCIDVDEEGYVIQIIEEEE